MPKFCFECGEAQIKCINLKCNELLFSDKAEFCHECHVPQQPQGTNGDGIKESSQEKGNANKSVNDNSKGDEPGERLSSDNITPTAPPDSHESSSDKTPALTSDSEKYHMPSPDKDKDKEDEGSKGATGGDQSNDSMKDVSQIDQPLTRLCLREHRKHERDESVGDSDDSNPTKKKALGDKKPPLSPIAQDSATLGSDEEKDGGKQKDLSVKGGQQREKIKSEVAKHPLQEDSATEKMEVPRTIRYNY